ncbi:hypothetical protein CPC08DRAFT_782326 [Agrocybe pediades]|nr:hypothetical protein CPC08DRAFT_782326 [Agrocybe pediades]
MPVATSSRRKPLARRQNSEDIEDVHTQPKNEDGVSDEEQPRAEKRVKKEKKGKQRAPANEDDEDNADSDEDEDDEDEDPIDVDNFPDQPLRKEDANKLKGIAEDWKSMSVLVAGKWELFRDVAASMAESGEKDIESSKELQKVDRDMREFLDVCAEMKAHSATLEAMNQRVSAEEDIDAVARYEEGLQERKDEYAGQTARKKYAKNKYYIEFHSGIWEVSNPKDPMPPLTNLIPRGTSSLSEGEESDDDDDLEIGGATQDYRCPLSLTLLEKPMTSRICGHSFSADAIREHCRPPNQLHKCPASGCNKSFRLSDCVFDKALEKKVKNIRRRQQAAEENSDAEEIVD